MLLFLWFYKGATTKPAVLARINDKNNIPISTTQLLVPPGFPISTTHLLVSPGFPISTTNLLVSPEFPHRALLLSTTIRCAHARALREHARNRAKDGKLYRLRQNHSKDENFMNMNRPDLRMERSQAMAHTYLI